MSSVPARRSGINLLNVLEMTVRMTRTPSPPPIVRSPSIKSYFLYRVKYRIHESLITSKYMREFANRDYIVRDNTKVVGYLINGYYFNFKYIYGV